MLFDGSIRKTSDWALKNMNLRYLVEKHQSEYDVSKIAEQNSSTGAHQYKQTRNAKGVPNRTNV